jgi:hypothetical protein
VEEVRVLRRRRGEEDADGERGVGVDVEVLGGDPVGRGEGRVGGRRGLVRAAGDPEGVVVGATERSQGLGRPYRRGDELSRAGARRHGPDNAVDGDGGMAGRRPDNSIKASHMVIKFALESGFPVI